jgi:hypothetical protein
MAKPRVSLEALTAKTTAAESSQHNNVVTLQPDNVKTSRRSQHTSLYLSPEVRQAIREIAFQFNRKPHDLYMEGIDLMLAQYGKPSSQELTKK